MAILNKIRQQSLVLIIVIAMALFAFILSGLFDGTASFSSKSQNVVATINGKDITRDAFLKKVEQAQQGSQSTNTQTMNRVWDQEVRQAVMQTQYDALGFTVETEQMRDLLKTSLANNPNFQNEAGIFDENKLTEYVANLKATSAVAYQQWVDYETQIAANALQQNYFNMVKAGLIGTLAEGELEHKLQSNTVDIKFVQIPFTSIVDSTVNVSKAEISTYINAHKKQYEVEASRNINYVEFKEVATSDDENAIEQKLATLLNDRVEYNNTTKLNDTVVGFSKVSDNSAFINTNSDIKFNDRFVFKSKAPNAIADSIFKMNLGEVFGPYKESNHFKISKIVAVTQMPDSVQARHILIPFVGSRSATDSSLVKEAARKQVDSLLAIFKNSKDEFANIAKTLSADPGSGAKGGDLGYFTAGAMVPTFNDFCFQGVVGDVGVVESVFGFHIIDIQDQKNMQRAVKIGTIARVIEPSETTIDNVFKDVSNFEIAVGKGAFQDVAKESNYSVKPVNDIKVLDESIPGLGNQRGIVRWAFEEDSNVGDIKRFPIAGGFAIVQLATKKEAGLMPTEAASVTALPILRKEKKAKLISERITATTLEDLATAEKQNARTALAINMKTPTVSGVGNEPLVVGTAFGLNEGETSGLIVGEKGVYMVQVTKVTPAVALDNYQTFANQIETTKASAVNTKLYNALKAAADIEDNRAKTVQ